MKHREFRRRPDLAGEIQMWRRRHSLDRDDVVESRIAVDVPANDVEKIDGAASNEPPGDLDALFARKPFFPVLIGDEPNTDDEIGADGLAHRVCHHGRKAHAVFERPAELILADVGRRRPEAVHQMAVGLELDAIEAGSLHALGSRDVVVDDPLDIPFLSLLGKRAVGWLADGARRQNRQPVALVPAGATAKMGQLDHHRRAMLVTVVRNRFIHGTISSR
jgi:hypothetical protein